MNMLFTHEKGLMYLNLINQGTIYAFVEFLNFKTVLLSAVITVHEVLIVPIS